MDELGEPHDIIITSGNRNFNGSIHYFYGHLYVYQRVPPWQNGHLHVGHVSEILILEAKAINVEPITGIPGFPKSYKPGDLSMDDDVPNWMENNMKNVPNHQPVYIYVIYH